MSNNTNNILETLASKIVDMVGECSAEAFEAWTVDSLPADSDEFTTLMLAEIVEAGNLADSCGDLRIGAFMFSFVWHVERTGHAPKEIVGMVGRMCFGYRHQFQTI